jgi:diketogulonate reductase-like aldo/keto reductase
MPDSLNSTVKLNNGVDMPRLGLGVFKAEPGEETVNAVGWALEAGYRHIDTATVYGNEADVGEGLRRSGMSRKDVFITTKVWNSDQGYDSTMRALDESLGRLETEYVDLYLIHWPVKDKRLETWKALVQLQRDGKCRAIGVSNFMEKHLDELLGSTDVVPAVNQIEYSPFLQQLQLHEKCSALGIRLEAYSPLTRARRLDDPTIGALAREYGKTPAQIMIRWVLQKGVVVIPKSSHRERIVENADVFDFVLTEEHMAVIARLDEKYSVMPEQLRPWNWE